MSLFCSEGERRCLFSTGAATFSVCAPFYIADKRDLPRAKRVKLRVTEAIIQLSRPSKVQTSMVPVA